MYESFKITGKTNSSDDVDDSRMWWGFSSATVIMRTPHSAFREKPNWDVSPEPARGTNPPAVYSHQRHRSHEIANNEVNSGA